LELAENKQLLKHLTDSQVKRGSRSRTRFNPSDAPLTMERCREWHESGMKGSAGEPSVVDFCKPLQADAPSETASHRKALSFLHHPPKQSPGGMVVGLLWIRWINAVARSSTILQARSGIYRLSSMSLFALAKRRHFYKVEVIKAYPKKQVGLVPSSLAVDSVLH
jgi:hypothetical protein